MGVVFIREREFSATFCKLFISIYFPFSKDHECILQVQTPNPRRLIVYTD